MKKVIALVLCFLIVFSLLTACGGNSSIDFTGVDHSYRPTENPADPSQPPPDFTQSGMPDYTNSDITVERNGGTTQPPETTQPPTTTEPPPATQPPDPTSEPTNNGQEETPLPDTSTEPPATTQPPSGNIDNKILGGWSYLIGTDFYGYQFNSDGTFIMINTWSLTSVEGEFYTSNGTVYLKNLISEYRDTTSQLADQESSYSFGSDDYGEYLMIKTFKTFDSVSESEPIHKFRRQ